MLEHQPKSTRVKEEVIGLEGDTYTDKGYSVKNLGMQGSTFKKQNNIKHGTMTKWFLDFVEKGVVINIELRTLKVFDRGMNYLVAHGEYIKLYERLPEALRNDSNMEQTVKEFFRLMIEDGLIYAPSTDIEVVPFERRYIIKQGETELYLLEYDLLT